MSKAFRKNDQVTVISSWDNCGTVSYRHATVHSCGAKVMKLICNETGEMFGRDLLPVCAESGEIGIRPALHGEELQTEAVKVAETFLERETARLIRCRDAAGPFAGPQYTTAIQKKLDALHEPRVEARTELLAGLRC